MADIKRIESWDAKVDAEIDDEDRRLERLRSTMEFWFASYTIVPINPSERQQWGHVVLDVHPLAWATQDRERAKAYRTIILSFQEIDGATYRQYV